MATYLYEDLAVRIWACCLLWASAACAQNRYAVDWQKLEPEILLRFTELLKIDTSNPPGNETKAATAIQAVLEREQAAGNAFAFEHGLNGGGGLGFIAGRIAGIDLQ